MSSVNEQPHEQSPACRRVANCLARSGQGSEEVSISKIFKALEYFIVPRSLWPTGLDAAAALREKHDNAAENLMVTVRADFAKIANTAKDFTASKKYFVIETKVDTGVSYSVCCALTYDLRTVQLPKPLATRLERLATAEFSQSSTM